MESPENDKTVFRPSHKSWKSLADCNGVLKIMPSDFHIPSATTATAKMTQIQNQKGHNPASPNLRTFRLILQLEKTEFPIPVSIPFIRDLPRIVATQNSSNTVPNGLERQPVSASSHRVPLLAIALVRLGIP
jgi:hypothetical protein